MQERKIIAVTVVNEHSVLARVSGLFAGRGYNIESLTVAPIPNTSLSRITIATQGDSRVLEQIIKQLHKLIPVLTVSEDGDFLEKESVLIKIDINEELASIEALAKAYNGKIANANEKYIIVVATEKPQRITSLIKAMQKFKPKEILRSGVIAMERY
ncbi:acetolactate synthase small subunit [Helicobacter fennelliae]|uniref:Acetolactate synthase small subunit n=2 Tax=Helicobacter fennelliae TaxID=215 RepID=T1DWH4_9HELI|nr:acetolactate synthase small subunit [Helicobacter fennelliae]GAD19638.1 acetolactate synthase small subunit [Helicobacter fennelliae MRY12-0050]SQB98584.1 acetolactate synthase 3 regulatory subunit [Helicobacter fennelliae]STP07930.1 acetolactate synthase 3 regulatory subunit [Helicobacter fennelliae]STQ84163.1 acetolactate synthase 3 regulatory subunit [Helicobacter fennelliae]